MTHAEDLAYCTEAIRHGSRSFYAASHLLPAHVREAALALYAFCRQADDAVDLNQDKANAVLRLRDRLDDIYAGRPRNFREDRAFAHVIETYEVPAALPEALLEGFAWDAIEKRYETLSDLHSYSARVASAVGAMMCVLMRERSQDSLARACDLGLAMQLTNIARDVGEDAREGRLYLPLSWLHDAGIDPEAFLALHQDTPEIRQVVKRLLREAQKLYTHSDAGIYKLPVSCRPGIFAARHIYAGIAGSISRLGHNTIDHRARTNTAQKVGWLGLALCRTALTLALPAPARLHAAPQPEVAFLVAAAAKPERKPNRSAQILDILAQLEERKRAGFS